MRAMCLVVVMVCAGCLTERDLADVDAVFNSGDFINGRLAGDIGPNQDFDGDARLVVRNDPDIEFQQLRVERSESVRFGMVILTINGPSLDTLDLGKHTFLNSQDDWGAQVEAIVCTGESENEIAYDEMATQVTVNVTGTENGRRYAVTTLIPANEDRGPQETTSAFDTVN